MIYAAREKTSCQTSFFIFMYFSFNSILHYKVSGGTMHLEANMNIQFKKGVLEILVLALLNSRDCYGYELVEEISKDVDISEGTIYPLLRRFSNAGLVETYLKESGSGPPRKYYKLTPEGKENFRVQIEEWNRFIDGVNELLGRFA